MLLRAAEIGKAQLRQGFARRVLQHGHQVGGIRLDGNVGQARSTPARPRTRPAPQRWPAAQPRVFDAVIHAAQHAGGVLHRLFMADLRSAWAE